MVLEMVKNHKNIDTFELYVEENLTDFGGNVEAAGEIGSYDAGGYGNALADNTQGEGGVVVYMTNEPAENNIEEDKSVEDSDSDRTYSPKSDEENNFEDDFEYFVDGDTLSDSFEDINKLLQNNLNSGITRDIDEPYIDHTVIKNIHNDSYYGRSDGLSEEGVRSDSEDLSGDGETKCDAPNKDIEWFNEETDMENPILFTGLSFCSVQQFRKALRQHAIKNGFEVGFEKNESDKVITHCKRLCGWRIHASYWKKTTAFQIRTLYGMPHRCPRTFKNKIAHSTWVAKRFMKDLLDAPNWSIQGFRRTVKRKCGVIISKKQGYRARKTATEWIKGNFYKQFHRVRDYCEMVLKQNPGSAAFLCLDRYSLQQLSSFKRVFIIFSALKEGFMSGCRPMIGLDAYFLKGPLGGQLMAAIARDGNNQMFPLAIAVVESECKESWTWFLESLIDQIGVPEEKRWAFHS
ncbi:uncharacterized protein [Nicotiana sylvestris]|uniref:Uncharacterized protein LOC104210583 n=1 Tax=Nicotiana sylvestris TaxID=4096 RepID=A0A1U7UNU5_NICSY|nr:PREDICTED: uncharacterized protein LOC104210583 [Nicotiana sylvestris]XP_009757813.1 PREDICTED: uncharacterized protein LOC104210583 [Nicotiana sylvestris]XP_009757814.1 PREDICTED: uncharacterized protein LOC104210583 [Nicotiana sylvestris]